MKEDEEDKEKEETICRFWGETSRQTQLESTQGRLGASATAVNQYPHCACHLSFSRAISISFARPLAFPLRVLAFTLGSLHLHPLTPHSLLAVSFTAAISAGATLRPYIPLSLGRLRRPCPKQPRCPDASGKPSLHPPYYSKTPELKNLELGVCLPSLFRPRSVMLHAPKRLPRESDTSTTLVRPSDLYGLKITGRHELEIFYKPNDIDSTHMRII
ncbi:hypothetical protein KQX54_012826 [Cotesia glomerata]|uniref:Uncharacterized protein n=1 Tax=Cotesia glomerata TaxID=32391 RepID=A0AAV7J4Z2_COTGL|nr:hypothetical protein KQX54_012826 [Cotesia glomerata]